MIGIHPSTSCGSIVMRSTLLLLALAGLMTEPGRLAADPGTAVRIDEAVLERQGVSADREGLFKLFSELCPSQEHRKRVAQLIRQLGDDDFLQREAASNALLRMPHPPLAELKQAAQSDDAEVRYRARRILAEVDESPASILLFAACRVIDRKQLPGLAPELLKAAAVVDGDAVRIALRRAMAATVGDDDVPALSQALRAGHVEARLAAVWGLSAVRGGEAVELIESLLNDPRQAPRVRLAAAEAMAVHQRSSGVTALVDLLDADDRDIRRKSAALLRVISGEQFGFDPDGSADERRQPRERWAQWLKAGGRMARPPAAPTARWSDYFDDRLVYGSYEDTRTEFVKGVPGILRDCLKTVTRTARTTGSVTDRHRTDAWLYPVRGKGERPRVLVEEGQRLYPVLGTWRQRWRDWIVLDENSAYIKNATAHGGAHWESQLQFIVVPVEE